MQTWIPLRKVETVVQLELLLLVLAIAISSWIVYRVALRGVTPERHKNLRVLFQNLLLHGVYLIALFLGYEGLRRVGPGGMAMHLVPYLGLGTILWGCAVFVKSCRILAFEYLFFSNMRAGVPLLIVNILTLILSLILGTWVLSGIFDFHLAPLLATSAVFSIVLGLALQDTLGNIFAGIALQFDKPYELGDWIEIQNGQSRWAGQVSEITWRATLLLSLTDEWITIPNRLLAQSEVSNFSARMRPFMRSHVFRVGYGEAHEKVRGALLRAAEQVPSVRRLPAPQVLLVDVADSWMAVKLIYHIDDYGRQIVIGDQVLLKALAELDRAGIAIAPPRLRLEREAA